MPNWKKVIVSGSNAVLNNITSSGNISASGYIVADVAAFYGDLQVGLGGTNTDGIKIGPGGSESFLTNINGLRLQPNTQDPNNAATPHVTVGVGAHITASGNISSSGDITGNSFIKGGGTSAQFLKADGSVDSTAYTTNVGDITGVTAGTGLDGGATSGNATLTLNLTEVGFGGTSGNLVTDDGDGTVTSQNNLTYKTSTGTLSVLGTPRSSGFISASSDIVAGENIFAGGGLSVGQSGIFGGNVTATDIIVGDDVRLANNSKIISENQSSTYILLNNDDYWRINANGYDVARFASTGVVINESSNAALDFRVESNNDTHALFVDSGNDKVAIGTSTVGNSLLTIDGDVTATSITASGGISSSGKVKAHSFAGNGSELTNIDASGFMTNGSDNRVVTATGTDAMNAESNLTFDGSTLTLVGSKLDAQSHISGTNLYIAYGAGGDGNIHVTDGGSGIGGNITASGEISASGKVYSTNINSIQFGFQSVGSAVQGTWYGPNNLGPNNTFWATTYGTAAGPGNVGLTQANSGWFVPAKSFITDAKLYIQNITDADNYAVSGALQVTDTISYPATANSDVNTYTNHTAALYSTTGTTKAIEEVTITVNQQVEAGVIMYPRFNVNGVTSNWRGTFVVNYYEIK